MTPEWAGWLALIGQEVWLTVSREPLVAFKGTLLGLSHDGEAKMLVDGKRGYYWPALDIKAVEG